MYRDRLPIESAGRRLRDRRGAFDLRKRSENHAANPPFQRSRQQIPEPAGVGFGKKVFGARREEPACKVNDDVDSCDREDDRRGIAEVGLNRMNGRELGQVRGQRPAVVHQPEVMTGRREMTGQQIPQVACGTSDENRRSIAHGIRA